MLCTTNNTQKAAAEREDYTFPRQRRKGASQRSGHRLVQLKLHLEARREEQRGNRRMGLGSPSANKQTPFRFVYLEDGENDRRHSQPSFTGLRTNDHVNTNMHAFMSRDMPLFQALASDAYALSTS